MPHEKKDAKQLEFFMLLIACYGFHRKLEIIQPLTTACDRVLGCLYNFTRRFGTNRGNEEKFNRILT